MTDSDERPEWVSWPGFSLYEASHRGRVRSVDGRVVNGRTLRGVVLKEQADDEGYRWVGVTGDDGKRYRIPVHRAVLLAHAGAPGPGQETLHAFGKADNRYPEAIRWGSRPENMADLAAQGLGPNGRPFRAPKPPPAPCIRCGGPVTKGGRRCHDCVVAIGKEAADLLRAGIKLEDANERLEYANAVYLHNLAVKYGGWGTCPTCSQSVADPPPVTIRERLGRALRPARHHGA